MLRHPRYTADLKQLLSLDLTRSLFMKRIATYCSPAALATVLSAVIVGILLFSGHGYANNGDFETILRANGLYNLHTSSPNYVTSHYGIMQYFNDAAGQPFSTQMLFIQLAILLNKLCFSTTIFDIRFLGGVYLVFYLLGVYCFIKALTKSHRQIKDYVIALLTIFMLSDSSFTLYFNSFYPQAGNFIFLLYCVTILLTIAHDAFKVRWPWITAYFILAFLLLMNHYDNIICALFLGIGALGFFVLPKFKFQRVHIALGIVLILIGGFWTNSLTPKPIQAINEYQTFTRGVLLENDDPIRSVKSGGIDSQYTLMRNQSYYANDFATIKPESKYVQKNLMDKYNFYWLVKYYVTAPHQLMTLLNTAGKSIMITQLKSVGNYPKSAHHKPLAQTRYFTGFSQFMGAFFPRTFGFHLLLTLALWIIYFIAWVRRHQKDPIQTGMMLFLMIALTTLAIAGIVMTVLRFGLTNLSQNLVLVALSWDLVLLIFVSDSINQRLWGGGVK